MLKPGHAPDEYFREPIGPHYAHRGTAELRSFFTKRVSAGGGISLEHCTVTDDGMRCAVEYNCVRWGSHDVPPRAGIGVYERGPDGSIGYAARDFDGEWRECLVQGPAPVAEDQPRWH
jgi:hypothetical protein